jgi:hypothetical protein
MEWKRVIAQRLMIPEMLSLLGRGCGLAPVIGRGFVEDIIWSIIEEWNQCSRSADGQWSTGCVWRCRSSGQKLERSCFYRQPLCEVDKQVPPGGRDGRNKRTQKQRQRMKSGLGKFLESFPGAIVCVYKREGPKNLAWTGEGIPGEVLCKIV